MRRWALLLAGPVIWLAHFLAVYLLVETGCAAELGHRPLVLGLSALALLTLAATLAAAAACAAIGVGAYTRWRPAPASPDAGLAVASVVLAAIFCFAVLLVGVPAAWVEPC